MLRTSALPIVCKRRCYKFMSIDFLRLRFARADAWCDHIPDSTELSKRVQWKKSYPSLHLSSLGITSVFFLSLDSRLGGWQPHCWSFQPDPGAEARAEVDSTVAEAFYLGKLRRWGTCKQLALQGFGAFRR